MADKTKSSTAGKDGKTVTVVLPGMGNAEHEIPATLWDAVQDLTDEETGSSPWRGAHLKSAQKPEPKPTDEPEDEPAA